MQRLLNYKGPVPIWWQNFEKQFTTLANDHIWKDYAKDMKGLKKLMRRFQLDTIEPWKKGMMYSLASYALCIPIVVKSNQYDLHLVHGVNGNGGPGTKFYVRRPFTTSRPNYRLWKTDNTDLYRYTNIKHIMYNKNNIKKCK